MEKIFFKLLALIALFLAILFTSNQVNWMELFKVEENVSSTEEKIGELFWELYEENNREINDLDIIEPIDSIFSKICEANGINKDDIKLHITETTEVNAFALPNKHLVINAGLIADVNNQEELAGVIGHEIAHMELDHVMKKLVKEVGLAVIVTMTSGNGNTQVILESLRTLTSSAYDRSLEEEADIKAVDYLIASNIDPAPFADFLYSLGSGSDAEKYLSWISTHPYSKERAEYIISYFQDKTYKTESILNESTWEDLKQNIEQLN